MENFISIISTFPTVIYSILMVVILCYWLIASLGLLDIDLFDADLPDHADGLHDVADGMEGLTGLLMKLGLNGVPVTIVLTFLVIFGWLLSYFSVLLIMPLMGTNITQFFIGIPVFVFAFAVSIPCTAITIRPLRKLFDKSPHKTTSSVLGKIGTIRSSKVSETFGELDLNDGGAHLLLRVRASEPNSFKKGDRAVLLEYQEDSNSYRIIPESQLY